MKIILLFFIINFSFCQKNVDILKQDTIYVEFFNNNIFEQKIIREINDTLTIKNYYYDFRKEKNIGKIRLFNPKVGHKNQSKKVAYENKFISKTHIKRLKNKIINSNYLLKKNNLAELKLIFTNISKYFIYVIDHSEAYKNKIPIYPVTSVLLEHKPVIE